MDPASGRLLRRVRVAASAPAVAYGPGGRLPAVGTGAGVVLMNPATGVVRARLRGGPATNSVAFSRDGRSLAADTIEFDPEGRTLAVGGRGRDRWSLVADQP